MSNTCYNQLHIHGEQPVELWRFFDENNGGVKGVLSFNRSHPMPSALSNDDACEWRCDNWHTKWDTQGGSLHIGKASLLLKFDTPWSPPLGWLAVVVAHYASLHFHLEYNEPDMCRFGDVVGKGGKIVSHLRYKPVELISTLSGEGMTI